ncbi:MAG: hypothetical protein EU536_00160 [Promethearchaeota archaeon]|nr:MAG: hypothetical protein EU536_00160 [Candidatus Lokiarchaeota archaeon]
MKRWLKAGLRGASGDAPIKQSRLIENKIEPIIKVTYETKGLWDIELQLSNKQAFNEIEIPNIGQNLVPGEPQVPQEGLYVAIPEGATVQDIKVVKSKKKTFQLAHQLKPAPEPSRDPSGSPALNPKQEIYDLNEAFPGELFKNLGVKQIGDVNVIHLMIYPVQYYPASNKIDLFSQIELEVEYKLSPEKAPLRGGPLRGGRKRVPAGYDDQILNLDNV